MYIFKNALKSITRAKARNILIGIITLIISVSACVALSIRESAETIKQASLDSMEITAQISVNRNALMQNAGSGSDRTSALQNIKNLTLDEMQVYAESNYVDNFYYTLTSSLNGDDKLSPINTSDSTNNSGTSNSANNNQNKMPNGMGSDERTFGRMGVQGDFTVVGYSSHDAMTAFKNGTKKITDGTVFDQDTKDAQGIISDELATLNELKVGDTINLVNPNNSEEIIPMTISGIYSNSESSTNEGGNMMGFNASSDPANQIYLSYNALKSIVDNSKTNATVTVDQTTGRESSTALREQESGTYVFSNVENYKAFEKDAVALGLDDSIYTVSSQDVNAYEQSLLPLNNLSNYAMYFLMIALIVGGGILIVFNVFAIRERKYEIGVLAAIGMNKAKIATQFITEVFIVTFMAIVIGTSAGAAVSTPVAENLLTNQITSVQTSNESTMNNFGGQFQGRISGNRGTMMDPFNNSNNVNYVSDITASTNVTVLLQILGIGILLTIISSATAVVSILRYEPLKILNNRS